MRVCYEAVLHCEGSENPKGTVPEDLNTLSVCGRCLWCQCQCLCHCGCALSVVVCKYYGDCVQMSVCL